MRCAHVAAITYLSTNTSQVDNTDLSLADMFERLEETRVQFNLTDQSISQTTLEQVFISFAKLQKGSEEERRASAASVVVSVSSV